MGFVELVESARRHFLQPEMRVAGPGRAYLEEDARIEEAEEVADLVARFSRAEIEGTALGRTIGSGIVKPMGAQIERALKKASPATRDNIRAAIENAVARTYVAAVGIEVANDAQVERDRTPEQIWAFWIPRIYSGYLKNSSGLAESDLNVIKAFGVAALEEGLASLDLGRKAKGRRVDLIGIGYGQAGAVLRLSQSSMTPNEWITDPPAAELITYHNLWPFKDYRP